MLGVDKGSPVFIYIYTLFLIVNKQDPLSCVQCNVVLTAKHLTKRMHKISLRLTELQSDTDLRPRTLEMS